jgi:formylglycine-generating enzyme required for sulfatase activity
MKADKGKSSRDVILRRSRRISSLIFLLVTLSFLAACAASTDWNNPCDHESSSYDAVKCAEMQQGGSKGVPSAPSGLTATAVSLSQINLSWTDNSDNEIGFIIERKAGTVGTYVPIGNVSADVTTFQDTTVICATTYYYRVKANNGEGDSDYSNEANATTSTCSTSAPNDPSNLQAAVLSSSEIDLSWQDNSNNEDGFIIERKIGSGGTYAEIATAGPGSTSYQDTQVVCAETYFYRVKAYGAGYSGYSNEANVTTGNCTGTTLAAPSGLTATVVQDTEITLLWVDNSDNETGFAVWRKTGAGGYTLITTTGPDVVSIVDGGLSPLTTYSYRVFAVNGAGSSTGYSESSATTLALGVSASMVNIPAGCFDMGDAFGEGRANESPIHNVCLSAFKMNVYEVTNAQYKACVDAASCTAPGDSSSNTRSSYYGNATYDNYPVIYVDWDQSKSFCQWTGGRLPTEAEWEYAVRGGLSGKRYPWGDDAPTCTLGATNGVQNGMCSPQDTIAVGSFAPNGYGLYDMAGNVWEWVNDWFSDTYYSSSPTQDPQGPSSGSDRVLRGGCWGISDPFNIRASVRGSNVQTYEWKYYGFRCVR